MLDRLNDLLNEAEVNFLMDRINEEQYQIIVNQIITIMQQLED